MTIYRYFIAPFTILCSLYQLQSAEAPSQLDQQLTTLHNSYRLSIGLAALRHSYTLDKSAMLKAELLCKTGQWTHTVNGSSFTHEFILAGYTNYKHIGENLARGYTDTRDAFIAWIDSPSHKDNIIGDYTEIGYGYSDCNGKKYIVVHFGK